MADETTYPEIWELLNKQKRLGDMFVEEGVITQFELEIALKIQKETSFPLAHIVIESFHNDVERNIKNRVEAIQRKQFVQFNLEDYLTKPHLKQRFFHMKSYVPYSLCNDFDLILLDRAGSTYAIAMAFPENTEALSHARYEIGCKRKEMNVDENFSVRLVWGELLSLRRVIKETYTMWDKFPGNELFKSLVERLPPKFAASINSAAMSTSTTSLYSIIDEFDFFGDEKLRKPVMMMIKKPMYASYMPTPIRVIPAKTPST